LYVEDAVEGILRAAEHYEGSLSVNLGTGEEVRILNLAIMIAAEAGVTGQIVWDTTKLNGQPRRCLDVSRAKELFGFQAKHALLEGLKKAMQWFLPIATIFGKLPSNSCQPPSSFVVLASQAGRP
jgi:GDP-L-fucose synthase